MYPKSLSNKRKLRFKGYQELNLDERYGIKSCSYKNSIYIYSMYSYFLFFLIKNHKHGTKINVLGAYHKEYMKEKKKTQMLQNAAFKA